MEANDSMRFCSTPQSVLNQEITKLAIVECVASVALYVGIGVYFGTFRYLAIAVVFAPLMLFRTEVSADWGLKVYTQVISRLERSIGWFRGGEFLMFFLVPIAGNAIRIVATVYWAVRKPLHTLRETPQNWLRQSLCTDFAHPPEVIPLEAVKGTDPDIFTFMRFLGEIREEKNLRVQFLIILACSPFIIIGWLPSVIYRISFKATALAYTPFIWLAHATLRSPLPLKTRLERITKGELEKVRRGLSWVILTTLVAKVALLFTLIDRTYIESKFPSQKFVASFVILDRWPWWQITLGTDALLTFFLLFFADAALARLDGQKTWRDETVLKTVSTVSFLRAALSIGTISHFFYIALVAVAPNSVLRLLSS